MTCRGTSDSLPHAQGYVRLPEDCGDTGAQPLETPLPHCQCPLATGFHEHPTNEGRKRDVDDGCQKKWRSTRAQARKVPLQSGVSPRSGHGGVRPTYRSVYVLRKPPPRNLRPVRESRAVPPQGHGRGQPGPVWSISDDQSRQNRPLDFHPQPLFAMRRMGPPR